VTRMENKLKYESIDLKKLRKDNSEYLPIDPFPHQKKAFKKLSSTFLLPSKEYTGGLLVLPTGAGKTFTAVNWICRNVISRKIKVLWLAQSSYLLDQASKSFLDNAIEIPRTRNSLNIRVVSSNPSQSKASSIMETDDVLIVTTQTAINYFNAKPKDGKGRETETQFKKYIKNCVNTGLFIVLDEAHHAPAYGCRTLLMGIKDIIKTPCVLGLTATPTHNEKKISGWLYKIFNKRIIYEAKKADLIAQNILANPRYLPKPTGREFEVDDDLRDRLVREHKDLREDIIEKLADDHKRNDFIISDYIKNSDEYGKTIIFADRWFQCEYLKSKLNDKNLVRSIRAKNGLSNINIKSEAIYAKVDKDSNKTPDAELIIKEFRDGKYDILANVRMLTEGVDVPDVKTVMLTRQTTSPILMTQMIGRALRGKKAGGGPNKTHANIVLFMDNWKGLIDVWAHPEGEEEQPPVVRGYRPHELIPIRLIELLSRQIESGINFNDGPFLEYIPVGWYRTEIVVSSNGKNGGDEELPSFVEYSMVYNKTRDKFIKFIKSESQNIPPEWANEKLDERTLAPQIHNWMAKYFDLYEDDISETLENSLMKIARHIAQNGEAPEFYPMEDREKYDLDVLVEKLEQKNDNEQWEALEIEFKKEGNLWIDVYNEDLFKFKTAFDAALNTYNYHKRTGKWPEIKIGLSKSKPKMTLEEKQELKKQILERDKNTCMCCGKKGHLAKLEMDHIKPDSMNGKTITENLQTLCRECNHNKNRDEIDFKKRESPLDGPKKELRFFEKPSSEPSECVLKRIINFFYHSQAVSEINENTVNRLDITMEIKLHSGNKPAWLITHKKQLIKYVQSNLGRKDIKDIIISESQFNR